MKHKIQFPNIPVRLFYVPILMIFFMNISLNAQIQRIEPPFWFSGMHNPEVQILFYGVDIAQCQVSTANPAVITNVKRTENPNYIFITINTKKVTGTAVDFTFKNKNKTAFTQKYELKDRRKKLRSTQKF